MEYHVSTHHKVKCEVTRTDDARIQASIAFDPLSGVVSMGWHERMTQDEFIRAVEGLVNQLRANGASLGFGQGAQ